MQEKAKIHTGLQAGLQLNIRKMQVMTTGELQNFKADNKKWKLLMIFYPYSIFLHLSQYAVTNNFCNSKPTSTFHTAITETTSIYGIYYLHIKFHLEDLMTLR